MGRGSTCSPPASSVFIFAPSCVFCRFDSFLMCHLSASSHHSVFPFFCSACDLIDGTRLHTRRAKWARSRAEASHIAVDGTIFSSIQNRSVLPLLSDKLFVFRSHSKYEEGEEENGSDRLSRGRGKGGMEEGRKEWRGRGRGREGEEGGGTASVC